MAVILPYNHALMALADYDDVKAIRTLYRRLTQLKGLAEAGDMVAASIVVDLETALFHPGVLTEQQRRCIIGHIVDHSTFRELEHDLHIDKSTIHYHVNIALKRLQTSLGSGVLYDR